jgi:BirA family biotin operon repressor/biotin-[acetyl-CoA-carboxylase] ligase
MKGDCDNIDFIIIGAGVNLNSAAEEYPDGVKDSAVSLGEITGRVINRLDFLNLFLQNFERNYLDFLQGYFPAILEKWIEKSAIIKQKIKVTNYNEIITGTVTEVTHDGNLIVNTDNGTYQVNSGDINYIKET